MKDVFNESAPTRFLFPIDGDCVNANDGVVSGNGVRLTATVRSARGCLVEIGGVLASEQDGVYSAEVFLNTRRTMLTAKNLTDGTTATVSVFFLPRSVGKYRISSDDNILFLADITANQDKYTSIFDNPYLAVYKKAHDLYGAKVHLNTFYAFDRAAAAHFSTARPDFDLSMMTDRFRAEWEANADWLKLSFHARSEYPDKPYRYASPETITEDFCAVRREILRFAGEKTFSGDVTTIHWGEADPTCVAALRDLGQKALTGYFELSEKGEPRVAYYAPPSLTRHIGERDFFVDTKMRMTFGRIDLVTNMRTLDKVMEELRKIIAHPHRGGFVSFMIHEQYFHRDYRKYLPDFEARVLEPARLLFENGYQGAFIKEIIS